MKTNTQQHDVCIDDIAFLARLHLSKEEKQQLHNSLESILTYFDKLSEIDVSAVEPSAHAFPMYNVFRDDAVGQPIDANTALQNAPMQRNNQIIVPKIVE